MAPNLGGLGRSIGALVALDTIVGTHRADHAAGLARRLDDGLEHKSGRGLSLGAGDAHDLDVVVGTVVDLRRQQGHGRANTINNQHRSTALLRQRLQRLDQRLLAHKCDAPASSAMLKNAGLKAAPLQKNTSPAETARESNEQPVTARSSTCSDARSSPHTSSSLASVSTVVTVAESEWCIFHLSQPFGRDGFHSN